MSFKLTMYYPIFRINIKCTCSAYEQKIKQANKEVQKILFLALRPRGKFSVEITQRL